MSKSLKPLSGDVLLPLSEKERAERDRLDGELDANEENAIAYIRALKEYRDRRYYRETHSSFDLYLADRRKRYSRQRASQLIGHVEILDTLAAQNVAVLPENERQTRELKALADPLEMTTAWLEAQRSAEALQPGSEWVKGAVETVQQAKDTGGFVDTGDGRMSTMTGAVIQTVAERKQRQRDIIQAGKQPPLAKLEGVVTWRGEAGVARNQIAVEFKDLPDSVFEKLDGGQFLRFIIYPIVESKK